jgi:hypothetical protein
VNLDVSLDELEQKVWDGGRINAAEARQLYDLPLEELGALAGKVVSTAQKPSMGCNIKWKTGNEPEYF